MLKYWLKLRGYKRQAGAVIALLPFTIRTICGMFSINLPPAFDDSVSLTIQIGALIWGVGWADKFTVTMFEKPKGA
jgi:hypothetical protein